MNKSICFVASARDYHAVDWYRCVKAICSNRHVFVATDSIEGEGVQKIVGNSDDVRVLFNVDSYLFNNLSEMGNIWRNIVKLIAVPVLAVKLRMLSKKEDPIFHAHSMYYIFLCWFARIKFIATPMGSDVLVRPNNSMFYRVFVTLSLKSAVAVTVDSVALQEKVKLLSGKDAYLVQNGIDCEATEYYRKSEGPRTKVISCRGVDPNYRILDLLKARNASSRTIYFDFIYPFYEQSYLNTVQRLLKSKDKDHGRVSKVSMYRLFAKASTVFSIPVSDSSPRSVYEAIFCGACVVVTPNKWIDALPCCMRRRIVVVDLKDDKWFKNALKKSQEISRLHFVPSPQAIQLFDELVSMKMVCEEFYGQRANV